MFVFRSDGTCAVGDLGLAAYLKPGEYIVKRAGTSAFMAPEVMKLEPASFKSDIWSLGIILYTMVCTHLPFPSKYYKEDREKKMLKLEIMYTDAAFESVNSSCIDLIRGMLEKDQNMRLGIEDVLMHPWLSSA